MYVLVSSNIFLVKLINQVPDIGVSSKFFFQEQWMEWWCQWLAVPWNRFFRFNNHLFTVFIAQRDNDVTQDNRDIQDDTTSQKLSRDDIMSLRQEGVEGETIIQEIVDNSATFKDRTEYSKAKYIKKKKKK